MPELAIIFVVVLICFVGVWYFINKVSKHIPTVPPTVEDTTIPESQLQEEEEDPIDAMMVPIMPNYNRVLQGKITDSDKKRLLRLKRAADAVHSYYEWVATDFRRIDDTEKHTKRIEALLQDVMACLELSQFQKNLAGFFCVCVLFEIKEEFMAGGPGSTMFPINVEALQESIFNAEDVIDAVHQKPDYYTFYLAGIFVPEDHDIDDLDSMTKAAIRRGAPVYSDDVLTTTDNLMDLVEAKYGKPYSEVDEEDHFEAFLDAIKALYMVNEEHQVSSLIGEEVQ